MKLNIAMIAKNESRCIEKSLRAAEPYVDDIIVVDTGSTDDTCEIVKHLSEKIRLYHFDWVNDFSKAKNFSLEMSEKNGADFTLVLDADEYLRTPSRDPREFIQRSVDKYGTDWAGYLVRYDQFYDDKDQIGVAESRTTRLLPRGTRYSGSIHEQPVFNGIRIQTPFVADHDGYLDKGKGERNLSYLKDELKEHPDDPYLLYQIGVALKSMKKTSEAYGYFSKFYEMVKGQDRDFQADFVRDGVIRYLYTLTDINTEESLRKALDIVSDTEKYFLENTDFYFFKGIFYMKLVLIDTAKYIKYLPEIEKSYLRCLEIGERDDQMTVAGTGSFKAWHNLGLWYQLNGDDQKAQMCRKEETRSMEAYSRTLTF